MNLHTSLALSLSLSLCLYVSLSVRLDVRQGFSEKDFDDLITDLTTQGALAIPLLNQLRTRSAHTGVTAAI